MKTSSYQQRGDGDVLSNTARAKQSVVDGNKVCVLEVCGQVADPVLGIRAEVNVLPAVDRADGQGLAWPEECGQEPQNQLECHLEERQHGFRSFNLGRLLNVKYILKYFSSR